jgi:hypothetical protein
MAQGKTSIGSTRGAPAAWGPGKLKDFMGFYGDFWGFHVDLLGFNGDFMGFKGDLIGLKKSFHWI